uniref:Uncharacterized protein n=1 Tax=Arion vulgaris TaxID=1028688 RepID=A0A0B7B441_9EUPU
MEMCTDCVHVWSQVAVCVINVKAGLPSYLNQFSWYICVLRDIFVHLHLVQVIRYT